MHCICVVIDYNYIIANNYNFFFILHNYVLKLKLLLIIKFIYQKALIKDLVEYFSIFLNLYNYLSEIEVLFY